MKPLIPETKVESLPQIEPARAKKKIDDPANVPEGLGWENKIDGERFKIHAHANAPCPCNNVKIVNHDDGSATCEGECPESTKSLHRCDSRCVGRNSGLFTEKTDRVPHLMNAEGIPVKAVIDSEFVSTADEIRVEVPGLYYDKLADKTHPHMIWFEKEYQGTIPVYPHVSMTTSVLGSLAEEAIRKQEMSNSWVKAYAFDLIHCDGNDLTKLKQSARRLQLGKLLWNVDPKLIMLMPLWLDLTNTEVEKLFYLLTDAEGEGLIGKDLYEPYNAPRNWYKLKRFYPVDCVITGDYKVGEEGRTGKMLGKVSSISVGIYHKGNLCHIGWMSAIMDDESALMTPEEFTATMPGEVVELHHNGVQSTDRSDYPTGYSLRHPRFARKRHDKSAKDCTLETLLAEIKKGNS